MQKPATGNLKTLVQIFFAFMKVLVTRLFCFWSVVFFLLYTSFTRWSWLDDLVRPANM